MNPAIDQFRRRIEPGILVFLLLGSTGFNAPSIVKFITNALIYLTTFFLIISERKRIVQLLSKDIVLLLLTGWAVASIFWSTVPQVTIVLVRALLLRTVLGMYLAARYSPKELLGLLNWVFSIAVLLSLGLSGHQGSAWTGIFSQKNEFARIMAVSALLCIASIMIDRKRWKIPAVTFAISILLLLLSQGRSSLVIFAFTLSCSIGLYWLMGQNYKLRIALVPIILILAGIAGAAIISNYDYIVLEVLKKPLDLNGRLPLWSYLIERGSEKLWTGYGYGAFFNTREEALGLFLYTWYGQGLTPRQVIFAEGMSNAHAHSGILDLFLSLGLIGLFLFALSLFTILKRLLQLLQYEQYRKNVYWMLAFILFMSLLNSTITGTILHQKHLFWITYIAIAFSTSLQVEKLEQQLRAVKLQPSISISQAYSNSQF